MTGFDAMTDPAARILARMRRLQSQGRRPELTACDAAVTLGATEDEARAALTELVQLRAIRPAVQKNKTLPSVWRLAE